MQDAVPPAGTTKEVTLFVEESEGHTFLRPLSYIAMMHLPLQS